MISKWQVMWVKKTHKSRHWALLVVHPLLFISGSLSKNPFTRESAALRKFYPTKRATSLRADACLPQHNVCDNGNAGKLCMNNQSTSRIGARVHVMCGIVVGVITRKALTKWQCWRQELRLCESNFRVPRCSIMYALQSVVHRIIAPLNEHMWSQRRGQRYALISL